MLKILLKSAQCKKQSISLTELLVSEKNCDLSKQRFLLPLREEPDNEVITGRTAYGSKIGKLIQCRWPWNAPGEWHLARTQRMRRVWEPQLSKWHTQILWGIALDKPFWTVICKEAPNIFISFRKNKYYFSKVIRKDEKVEWAKMFILTWFALGGKKRKHLVCF